MKAHLVFRKIAACIGGLYLAVFSAANGAHPFEAEATAEDGSGLERSITSTGFESLITEVIRAEGQFSVFEKRESFFSVNYGGLKDAFTLRWSRDEPEPKPIRPPVNRPPDRPDRPSDVTARHRLAAQASQSTQAARAATAQANAPLTEAVLEIPITGFRKTFTGENREEVEDQIIDFLKGDGKGEYDRFLAALHQESKISPLDGNPNAATARAAAGTFSEFGQISPENVNGNETGVSVMAEVGRFAAGEFEGDAYSLPISYTRKITDKVSVVINLPVSYLEIEGAEIYNANLGISVPIRFRQASLAVRDLPAEGNGKESAPSNSPAQPWTWQVTPTVGAIDSYSQDFGTAGMMSQASLTNLVAYRFERFTVAMGNHISWLEGYPVGNGDYEADPGVSQVVIKNGLQVLVPLGDRWGISAYGIYTRFLQDAAVSDYFTVGGDIGYRPFASSEAFLKLGIYSDIGNDYETATVRFGSGWKF